LAPREGQEPVRFIPLENASGYVPDGKERVALARFDECETLPAATVIEKRSATRNCPFPGAERLPGVGRTWSVH